MVGKWLEKEAHLPFLAREMKLVVVGGAGGGARGGRGRFHIFLVLSWGQGGRGGLLSLLP